MRLLIISILALFFSLESFAGEFKNHSFYKYNDYIPNADRAENVLVILDSSYSMNEMVGEETKMTVAKKVIYRVLRDLPPFTKIGLRVYGESRGAMGFGACTSSSLKVPVGTNNRNQIRQSLAKIQPVGMTPIAHALNEAVDKDFATTNGKKRIILISDGVETCGGDPCEYAIKLFRSRANIKIDVIGFDLEELAAISQLKCVALSTKGRFYNARNENDLAKSLIESLNIFKDVQGRIISD